NSEFEYFLGPEVPGEIQGGTSLRDSSGALKRQGARFRIYGFNARGQVVREITSSQAEIEWSVHPANRKAAWYKFEEALDIPNPRIPTLRNATLQGADRNRLVIDPGARTITGRNQSGVYFDSGTFLGESINLGELRTDSSGRLIVLGGFGEVRNLSGKDRATHFANNDGWCDDISDGPVTATVHIGTEVFEADPAWVVTAPPNYTPGISASIVTMYDVIEQAHFSQGWIEDEVVSFTDHIYPILERFTQLEWVNAGILRDFGWGSSMYLLSSRTLRYLSRKAVRFSDARNTLFSLFRDPNCNDVEPDKLPPMYGDQIRFPAQSPKQWLSLTPLQYQRLSRWAAGDFQQDWSPAFHLKRNLLRYPIQYQPLQEQPDLLTRAALEPVLGGAFHPGYELSWNMRFGHAYMDLFRLRHREPHELKHPLPSQLTPEFALNPEGPLSRLQPGDLTKWMALPWQVDAAMCRYSYDTDDDPYLDTFWPARVPNHVLTSEDYQTVMNRELPLEVRQEAFQRRSPWFRNLDLHAQGSNPMNQMLQEWHRMLLISEKPGLPFDR
ncbi:MAG: LodA/GoxA family CTQ-dependent oxidase, partial [Bdellovibrionales bacterium]|nr:LodA/GoxA family CTQ-dependent oxidase [Bdellovibrionales bacterium]